MGNVVVTPCLAVLHQNPSTSAAAKLVFWGGAAATRSLRGRHVAGEIMFEFPDTMVCHAGSFFVGRPVPALSIDDELMPGQTYFVLPVRRFACSVVSAPWLASLRPSSSSSSGTIKFGECPNPFEYLKGSNGRVLIKVSPEFMARLIEGNNNNNKENDEDNNYSFLCSTPELKKHYEQLVMRSKDQVWSPKLETISESKVFRFRHADN